MLESHWRAKGANGANNIFQFYCMVYQHIFGYSLQSERVKGAQLNQQHSLHAILFIIILLWQLYLSFCVIFNKLHNIRKDFQLEYFIHFICMHIFARFSEDRIICHIKKGCEWSFLYGHHMNYKYNININIETLKSWRWKIFTFMFSNWGITRYIQAWYIF